jgi:hypothetical protein
VHSKGKNRIELPRPSLTEKLEIKHARNRRIVEEAEEQASINRSKCRRGSVKLGRLRMMKSVDYVEGYLPVFPNYKHEGRTDGLGCPSLSPFNIGPIPLYGNIKEAVSLEAFHQWSKCFSWELDRDGNPGPEFYKERLRVFTTPGVATRHKGNMADFEYFVYDAYDGTECHYSYLESRGFYCTYYDILVRKMKEYKMLRKALDEGYNLTIYGYDAKHTEEELRDLEACYKNPHKPFGHEIILYTMLTNRSKPWKP